MEEILQQINNVLALQRKVAHVHSLYGQYYPIVIVSNNGYDLFDVLDGNHYRYVKKINLPMSIPDDIGACFPLEDYHGKYCCIMGYKRMNTKIFPIVCLHEMVHCYQGETGENHIKKQLSIFDEHSPLWEIMYPFDYSHEEYVPLFERYLQALQQEDMKQIQYSRKILLQHLTPKDREYLIWQEWKEGFARYVENQVRRHVGRRENSKGETPPYSRQSFYRTGGLYIGHLRACHPESIEDLQVLYDCLAIP